MNILDTLAPVFLLIALGAVLLRTGFFHGAFLRELNRLTYWVGLPALLFQSLATARQGAGAAGPMFAALLAATLGALGLGYLTAGALRTRLEARGTLVQAAFRGNLAYVGLPILFALPDGGGPGGSARTAAILALAPLLVVYNVAAVIVLLASRREAGGGLAWHVTREVAKNPLVLASVAGGLWALAGWPLPAALARTLAPLGELALPAALLCIGGALVATPLRGNRRAIAAGALLKTCVCPLLGWAAARALGLEGGALRDVLVFCACPTAAASYTLALELGGDEALASGGIVLGTLFSAVTLALVVGLF